MCFKSQRTTCIPKIKTFVENIFQLISFALVQSEKNVMKMKNTILWKVENLTPHEENLEYKSRNFFNCHQFTSSFSNIQQHGKH